MVQQRSEISLSPGSWHARLIKWVFGFGPSDFRNLCPYFWLLIASLFLVIPVTPIKLIFKAFFWVGDVVAGWIEESTEESFNRFVNDLSKGEIFFIMCGEVRDENKLREKSNYWKHSSLLENHIRAKLRIAIGGKSGSWWADMREKIRKKYENNNSWQSWVKEFEEEADQVKRKLEFAAERDKEKRYKAKKRSEVIADIVATTKAVVKGIIVIPLVFIGYMLTAALTNGFAWAFSRSLGSYLTLLYIFLGIIAFILICSYGYWCTESIKEWREYRSKKPTLEWICLIPALPVVFILWILEITMRFVWDYILLGIGNGIYTGFKEYGGIFADYFDASYSDYCPGINWEKEDKK